MKKKRVCNTSFQMHTSSCLWEMSICFVKLKICSKTEKTTLQTCHKYFSFMKGSKGSFLFAPSQILPVLPRDLLVKKDH